MDNEKQNLDNNINNLNDNDITALFGQKNVENIEKVEEKKEIETNEADKVAKILDNTEIDYESLKKEKDSEIYDANHPTLNNVAKSLVEESKSTELNVNVVNPATVGNIETIEKIVGTETSNDGYKGVSPRIILEKSKEEEPKEETIKLKPDPISKSDSVKILEPKDEIVKIRETDDSIENYEKTLEEEELEKSTKETRDETEKYEKLKETLEKDFEIESDDIKNIKIVNEITEEKQEETVKTEDEKEVKIKYLGGNPKDKSGWPFIEKPNAWSKKYMNLPKDSIPENIVGEELFLNSENIDEYIIQKNRFNSMVKTKVALPFSGMTIYIRSFKNSTFTKVIDDLARWDAQRRYVLQNNSDIENANFLLSEAYYKLRKTELESIYKHIDSIYLVNKGLIEKPEMNELFKMIKYPDLQQLYFAVYHGTNANRRKKYRITCHNPIKDESGAEVACGYANTLELYDEELVFGILNENLSEKDFYLLISDSYPKDRTLNITKQAKKEIHRLTSTKTNIIQHVPSIWDYLETMTLMLEMIKDPDVDIDIDLTNIDIEIPDDEWDYQYYDKVKLLKTYLYTKQIDFLWLLNPSTDEVRYKTVSVEKNQRREIFDILLDLPFDDMLSLTRGKEIKEMMALKALDYYVPEFTCKGCGKKINPVSFDIRTNFFIQLSEMRRTKG